LRVFFESRKNLKIIGFKFDCYCTINL